MSLTYPDNDNRENRMNQLVSDVNSSIIIQSNASKEVNSKITELSNLAKKMVKALEPDLEVPVDNIKLYKISLEITDIIVSALTFTIAYNVLLKVAASLTLNAAASAAAENAGEEGIELVVEGVVEEAAEELAIPMTTKIIAGFGGAVVSAGIGVAIDAITGSIARDKLRDKIHEVVPIRVTQKVNELQITKLLEEVGSMLDAYQIMQKLGYTKKQMEREIELTIEKFKPELKAITPDVAKQQLAMLDTKRGSWTNED